MLQAPSSRIFQNYPATNAPIGADFGQQFAATSVSIQGNSSYTHYCCSGSVGNSDVEELMSVVFAQQGVVPLGRTTTRVVIIYQNQPSPTFNVSYNPIQTIVKVINDTIGIPLCSGAKRVLPIQCTAGIINLFDFIGLTLIALLIAGVVIAVYANPRTGKRRGR